MAPGVGQLNGHRLIGERFRRKPPGDGSASNLRAFHHNEFTRCTVNHDEII